MKHNKNRSCIQRKWNKLQSRISWKKDPIEQLEASNSSIKYLFSDLLDEIKGFKYQVTLKVTLKKYKPIEEIEFRPVYSYFNKKDSDKS